MKTNNIEQLRIEAKHGDFYFASFTLTSGLERKSPVFIVSNDNDTKDVVVCVCTSQPARTNFDVKVELKKITQVRTNKLYTISREQLLFPIKSNMTKDQYNNVIKNIKLALNLE